MWLVAGHTDMRKGFDGLAAIVQSALSANPFEGHVFVFRGRRGDILKVLWFDGQGLLVKGPRGPERLWLLSIGLQRRGHRSLAKLVKNVNSAIYHNSLVSKTATAVIAGLGPDGYPTAVAAMVRLLGR